MTTSNPYSAPQVDVEVRAPDAEPVVLASPGSRLGAVIVDSLVFVPGYAILAIGGALTRSARPGEIDPTMAGIGGLVIVATFVVFCYFVATRSQTIGKRALGIYVARPDGQRAGFWRIMLLRNVLIGLIQWALLLVGGATAVLEGAGASADLSPVALVMAGVAMVLPLVDHLMIFSSDHRTLHDRLGGTIVARVR